MWRRLAGRRTGWEVVDAALANSRDQKATAGGISSTRLVHVFDSSSSDDDSGGDEYSDESEKDEGIGSSESDNEDDEEGGSNSGSDDELPTADVHLHKRQNSDYYLAGQIGKTFEVDGIVWTCEAEVDEDTVGAEKHRVLIPRFAQV